MRQPILPHHPPQTIPAMARQTHRVRHGREHRQRRRLQPGERGFLQQQRRQRKKQRKVRFSKYGQRRRDFLKIQRKQQFLVKLRQRSYPHMGRSHRHKTGRVSHMVTVDDYDRLWRKILRPRRKRKSGLQRSYLTGLKTFYPGRSESHHERGHKKRGRQRSLQWCLLR